MENKGLLFIPDISGFTKFVTETEINHSRIIVQELLETLINANNIGLEISEVEGDAILFYRFGERPDLKEVYGQVENMFREFHRYLSAYDAQRFCQCKACISAKYLTVKIITHYGEFTQYHVKSFNKLLGKDVIVAHQLLKNDIDQHEYWLVTDSLFREDIPHDFRNWMRWSSDGKQTESGELKFHYTQLGQLKKEIKEQPVNFPALSRKKNVLSVSDVFDAHIITLFHATGDFNYRHRWQVDVKKVEEITHFLPRIGMKCKRTLENGEATVYMSSCVFRPERIEFSETDEKTGNTTLFILEKIETLKTRLTIQYYTKKGVFEAIAFRLNKRRKMRNMLQASLKKLHGLVKEIHVDTAY
jgi:hypothetical protein